MKVYTKTGDNGTTRLYDGSTCLKNELIFDVLGNLDELSAHIGKLLFLLRKISVETKSLDFIVVFLLQVQQELLNFGSIIATPNPKEGLSLPSITDAEVLKIECMIDRLTEILAPLTRFIIQEGINEAEAESHICRTVTRRCEREMYKYSDSLDSALYKYINRLSDFFFTLARYISETCFLCKN